ncbi:hypothetical protein RFI_31972 [Reticulomyxa filosa]|uniref:Uncharacterized protein n=1 Tax=Reticulomyxa filosa TaxID=46433 RepID=X6LXJ6_RETFI|nr:hypothetical protein RFI_31972 [Reticulomyxa filosa]|eukprot:ETO05425.1 hypothetical protein RFI_31972 [Reticulomyxa filosa]
MKEGKKKKSDKKKKSIDLEGLECGAIVAISNKNLELFERVLQQLKQFYSSKFLFYFILFTLYFKVGKICIFLKQSTKRQYLQGLYLMFLLVKNKQEAFHTEIELLEFEDLDVKDQIYYTKNKTYLYNTTQQKNNKCGQYTRTKTLNFLLILMNTSNYAIYKAIYQINNYHYYYYYLK